MHRKFIAAAASLLAIAACSAPETALAQAPEYAAAESAAAASGPALWRLADEDTTIYLFGTVHVLPEGLNWLNPTVEGALTGADQFVSEIDTSLIPEMVPGQAPPPEVMEFVQTQMRMAQLTTGGTLRDLMNAEDRAEYEAALGTLGVPAEALDGFEPWMASLTIAQLGMAKAGMDPATGVERSLDRLIEGKTRAAFETPEQQLGFFDSMAMEAQLEFLDQSVEALPEMREGMGEMIDAWIAGNPDTLAAIMNEGMSDPAIYDALLADRNRNWAEWLDNRMDQPGQVFVAVGAGHLAGRDSVQDLLAARGFTVERVQY